MYINISTDVIIDKSEETLQTYRSNSALLLLSATLIFLSCSHLCVYVCVCVDFCYV